ncbi:DNA gyrase, A subunit, partial [Streptococcus agalactiae 18RS21]
RRTQFDKAKAGARAHILERFTCAA